ncbi:hypothetical protein THAOC_06117, partial [Thalassiosira oceanica]
ILSVPGFWSAQISAEQWGAVLEDEVATGVHGVVPLPMGIARDGRCIMGADINTMGMSRIMHASKIKGKSSCVEKSTASTAPTTCLHIRVSDGSDQQLEELPLSLVPGRKANGSPVHNFVDTLAE